MGLATAGPLGALVGIALGHSVDRGIETANERVPIALRRQQAQRTFFRCSFLLLGHVAKSDGRVSEAEIDAVESIMKRMRLSPAQRREAVVLFNRGKREDFMRSQTARELARALDPASGLRRLLLDVLIDVATADGGINPRTQQVIEAVGSDLLFDHQDLQRLLRARGRRRQQAVSDPYSLLGVRRMDSDVDIKIAYRRLMSQHHPDKLVARGLPEEMIELAKEKTTQIRLAYDQIRRERQF